MDFWNDLPEQVQNLILKSREQSALNVVIPHEQVIEKARMKICNYD